jgi:diguanylate cyclase (GGDEF)-like protein
MAALPLTYFEPDTAPIPIGRLTQRLIVSAEQPEDAAAALIEQFLEFSRQAERTIADQAARIEQLELLSLTDELTGLPNRRHFDREFNRRLGLAKRYGEQGAVALVDMDRFKAINDTYGHSIGDQALHTFGQMLVRNVRTTDLVARLGGDEFVILMIQGNGSEAMARMRLVQRLLNSTRLELAGNAFHLSASFGIATYGPDDTVGDVMRRADLAMYADKHGRRAS